VTGDLVGCVLMNRWMGPGDASKAEETAEAPA